MLVIFFEWQGVIHKEFVPEGETINAVYYKGVMERFLNRIRRVRSGMCKSGDCGKTGCYRAPHTPQSRVLSTRGSTQTTGLQT